MKKILSMILIAVLVLSVVGCTQAGKEEIVLPPTRYGTGGGLVNYVTYDVADFYADAEVVARVKVGNWLWEDNENKDNVERTFFEAQVLECYKGTMPENFTLMQSATSKITLEGPIFTYGNEKILFMSKAAPGRSPYKDAYGCGGLSAMDVSYSNDGKRYIVVPHSWVAGSITRTTPIKDLPVPEVIDNLIKSDPILEDRVDRGSHVFSEEDIKLFFASLEQEEVVPLPEKGTGVLPLTRFARHIESGWWSEEDTFEALYAQADVVARLIVGDWLGEDKELGATYYNATAVDVFKGKLPKNFTLKQNGCSEKSASLLFTYGNELLLFLKAEEDSENTYAEFAKAAAIDISYDDEGNAYYLPRNDHFGATIPCSTIGDNWEAYQIYENLIEQDLMIEVSRDGWRKIFGRSDPYTFRESELNDWFAEQKNG
jgi:hypothetical protein